MALQRPSRMPATRRIGGLLVMWNSERSIRYMYSDTSSSISTWPARSGWNGVPISWLKVMRLKAATLPAPATDGSSVSVAPVAR